MPREGYGWAFMRWTGALILLGVSGAGPATRPAATRPSTAPALKAIEYESDVYLMRRSVRISVSAKGVIRWELGDTALYRGRPDEGPKEVREGQLSPEQMADLAARFAAFDRLADGYGAVADGPSISLTYGAKKVSGGGGKEPQLFGDLVAHLTKLAEGLPNNEK